MTTYTESRETLDDGTVIVTRTADPAPAINGNGKPHLVVDADPIGPGHDDDYIFTTATGKSIRIRSMAKGKNPPPFAMMKAEAAKNYSQMTLLVLKAKAGKNWPEIEAILEEMDEDDFKAFSEGYSEHSGISTGE